MCRASLVSPEQPVLCIPVLPANLTDLTAPNKSFLGNLSLDTQET